MFKEIVLDLKGFEGKYKITNSGNIIGLNGKPIKIYYTQNPYVFLKLGNERKVYRVLELIAEHFIDNPKNHTCVTRIDPELESCAVSNVKWCSEKTGNNPRIKQLLPADNVDVTWKSLFDGYEISDWGQIKVIGDSNKLPLTLQHNHGKLVVEIKKRVYTVKRLVAQLFLQTPKDPSKKYVICKDGDERNLHFSNLKWVSRSEIHRLKPIEIVKIPEDQKSQVIQLSKRFTKTEISNIYQIPLERVEELLCS